MCTDEMLGLKNLIRGFQVTAESKYVKFALFAKYNINRSCSVGAVARLCEDAIEECRPKKRLTFQNPIYSLPFIQKKETMN